jgi:hypothetical protein
MSNPEPRDLDVAVLSPYAQQVRLLKRHLSSLPPPPGIKLLAGANESRMGARPSWAHTVDSFQGNQADVIFVSLVRNNATLPGDGLGFLREASRLNVLLSRAERLLIIVGSWDFFNHQVSTVSANDCAPHRRAVARRKYSASGRWKTHPKFQDGPKGRKPDAGGNAKQPPAQLPRKLALKITGIGGIVSQTLGHKDRVLSIITDHASTEDEALTPRPRPPSLNLPGGKILCRQTQAVPDGGTKQDSMDGMIHASFAFSWK